MNKTGPALASLIVLVATTVALSLWAADGAQLSRQEQVSYSIGYDLGHKMRGELENLDLEHFRAGIEDAYLGREPKLGEAEMDFIVQEFARELARKARDQRERVAVRNRTRSREFLEENAKREGVAVTPSGLQYRVIREGRGPRPRTGSRVRVHHRATLLDGTEFDNTYSTKPADFVLTEAVIPGYLQGLELMSEGSRWTLFVPPHLGYGAIGQPSTQPGRPAIEPNATLIFEVELLSVNVSDDE